MRTEDGDMGEAPAETRRASAPTLDSANSTSVPTRKGSRRREERREDADDAPRRREDNDFEEVTTIRRGGKGKLPSAKTPLGMAAAVQNSMVDVTRIGPGEGPGWHGRLYMGQQVSYAWCGKLSNDEQLFEAARQRWQGGEYRFDGKDEEGNPITCTRKFDGAPLPLSDAEALGAGGEGFQQGFQQGGFGFASGEVADPLGESFDPTVGVAPEELSASSLNGWFQNGQNGRWLFYMNGQPTRPPRGSKPPVAAAGFGGFGPFGPGAFDHTEPKEPAFSMADWLKMQAEERRDREERERDRREQERDERREEENRRRDEESKRREDEREARRDEENRRREAEEKRREDENKRREDEREARREDEERRREDRKAVAEAAERAARAQADAIKEAARLQAEATKDASNNQRSFFELMLKKSDGSGFGPKDVMDFGLQVAQMSQGAGRSDAAEMAEAVSTAVEKSVPALAKAGTDIAYAVKGYPAPGGQMPGGALGGAPQIPGVPQPQQLPGPGVPDAATTIKNLNLAGYLIENCRLGHPPSVPILRSGVIAYGLGNEYTAIAQRLLVATPEIIAQEFAKGATAVGKPFSDQIALVQQVCASPEGRNWLLGLKQAVAKALTAAASPAPAPRPAPAPATVQGATITPPAAPAAPANDVERKLAEEQSKKVFPPEPPKPPADTKKTTLS